MRRVQIEILQSFYLKYYNTVIYENVLTSNIRRGVRKGFKRLRKSQWTNESLKTAIPKANAFLKHKYALDGPKIFYNFQIVERKGRVVGMAEGEYYYYQELTYDCAAFWGDAMNSFIEAQGLQSKL